VGLFFIVCLFLEEQANSKRRTFQGSRSSLTKNTELCAELSQKDLKQAEKFRWGKTPNA
jgi:hypothetical protein